MWFKNLKLFRITQSLDINEIDLQDLLGELPFRPCGSQETVTMGWSSPFQKGEALCHAADGKIWLTLKKQERLLPAAVVNAELADKVAQVENETGSMVPKKVQQEMKQEIVHRLLPQAFTKNSFVHGFLNLEENLIVIDSSSDAKAEVFLAMLRKVLGSLPVVPFTKQSVQEEMTQWLEEDKVPSEFIILEEAELRSPVEDGAIVRCKNQALDSEEISQHIKAGKLIQKIAVEWDESLSAIIQEDLTIKRLKFSDVLREQNDDIPKDQLLARMDANFALMSGEILRFTAYLDKIFNLPRES